MKALTGNRLDDGEAIFLGHDGGWVPRFVDAALYGDDEAALAAEARAKMQGTVVVDPYLIDVIESEGAWAPLSFRERVRALSGPGPTSFRARQEDRGRRARSRRCCTRTASAAPRAASKRSGAREAPAYVSLRHHRQGSAGRPGRGVPRAVRAAALR